MSAVADAFIASSRRLLDRHGQAVVWVSPGAGPSSDPVTGELVPAGPESVVEALAVALQATAGQFPGVEEGQEVWHVESPPFEPHGGMFPRYRSSDPDTEDGIVDLLTTHKVSGVATLYVVRLRQAGSSAGP